MNSEIWIVFEDCETLVNDDEVSFDLVSILQTLDITETLKGQRTAPFQYELFDPTGGTPVETKASFGYFEALQIDLNAFDVDIFYFNNIQTSPNPPLPNFAPGIQIVSNNPFISFDNFSITGTAIILSDITPAPDPTLLITGATITGTATPCTTVDVTLAVQDGTPPYTWVDPLNGNAGLVGELTRTGLITDITLGDSLLDQSTLAVQLPDTMTVSDILNITQVPEPSGLSNTVTITMQPLVGVNFQFSLDGISFTTSNVFPGLANGDYTIFVIDQYGCQIEDDFTVLVIGVVLPPFINIPLSNSIGFFLDSPNNVNGLNKHYNGHNIQPNDYTLPRFNNPAYCQPWNALDTDVRTQLKTSYENISSRILDRNGVQIDTYPINQVSNNIGLEQALQTNISNIGNGETAVWFSSGNNEEYDPDTGAVIGTHDFNGNLPIWAEKGRLIFLSGTTQEPTQTSYEILKITRKHPVLNADVMVITRTHQAAQDTIIGRVDATYNKLNYEVYEIVHNFQTVVKGQYTIEISITDPNHTDLLFISNPISMGSHVIDAKMIDHVYAEYSGHACDGIDYSTGIVHKQRFQGLQFHRRYGLDAGINNSSKNVPTKTHGVVSEIWKLDAIDIPYWVYEKLNIMASKNLIVINGITVQTEDGLEEEESELYQRISLKGEFINTNYEQNFTDTFDIDGSRGLLTVENDSGFLEL